MKLHIDNTAKKTFQNDFVEDNHYKSQVKEGKEHDRQ